MRVDGPLGVAGIKALQFNLDLHRGPKGECSARVGPISTRFIIKGPPLEGPPPGAAGKLGPRSCRARPKARAPDPPVGAGPIGIVDRLVLYSERMLSDDRLPSKAQIERVTGFKWGIDNPAYRQWLLGLLARPDSLSGKRGRYNPGYKYSRNGLRIARRTVDKHFRLQAGNVVHHWDGDETNNNLDNLAVFANNSDHMRYHAGYDTTPIWDGRSL